MGIVYRVRGYAKQGDKDVKINESFESEDAAMTKLLGLKQDHPFGIFVVVKEETIAGYWG